MVSGGESGGSHLLAVRLTANAATDCAVWTYPLDVPTRSVAIQIKTTDDKEVAIEEDAHPAQQARTSRFLSRLM